MKIDEATLTPEAREAIIECLRIAARRGRQLREARERNQDAASSGKTLDNVANEKEKHALPKVHPQPANDSMSEKPSAQTGENPD